MKSRELRSQTVDQLLELKRSLQRELLCYQATLAAGSIRSISRSRTRRTLARVLTTLSHEFVQKGG